MSSSYKVFTIFIIILTIVSFRLVSENMAELTGRSADTLFSLQASRQVISITVLGEHYQIKPDLGQLRQHANNLSRLIISKDFPL